MFRNGEGTAKSWRKALLCYEQAAEKGHCTAMYWLYSYHAGEEGARGEPRLARTWLRRMVTTARNGAAKDDGECLLILGILHYNGQGVEQSFRRAAALYRRAAGLGDARAAYCLSLCYGDGDGVARDLRQRRAWLVRAARLGDSDAREELAKTERQSVRSRRR